MSTIILCLMECQCMQIRAEEQDDDDKQEIALMGQKPNLAHSEKANLASQLLGVSINQNSGDIVTTASV